MIIGSHVSFKKDDQIIGSLNEAMSYGANAFMFYTGAPQNTNRSEIDMELVTLGKKVMQEAHIDINNVVIHAPYIINMANENNEDFNVRFLKEEIKRVEILGFTKMVIHPGSHVGLGVEIGIKNIINCLNKTLKPNMKIDILLETMAGKGTEVGKSFEELKQIIDGIICKDKVKVCMDTCHMHDAGYDLGNFDLLLQQFDKIIGIDKIGCIHINDSKNELGMKKDRHENIGYGKIGFEKMLKIIYHPYLKNIPKILETPYVSETEERLYPPYKFEIEMIKNKKFNSNLIQNINNYYKK